MSGYLDPGGEERLRAILRAEADDIQPAGDGLQKIRERTAQPGIAWLAWLRPAAAVAAAVAIVGTVLVSTPTLREQFMPALATSEAESQPPQADGIPSAGDSQEPGEEPEGGANGGGEPDGSSDPEEADQAEEGDSEAAAATSGCDPEGREEAQKTPDGNGGEADEDIASTCEPEDPGASEPAPSMSEEPPADPDASPPK